jgi:predicted MPP superfamily phosphohydrolase
VVVRRLEISLGRLPEAWDGVTIAQLSDFHYDPSWSADVIRRAVEITNSLKPDAIALTGDYVTVPLRHSSSRKAAWEIEPCAELLRGLIAPHGIFAVLGNHDAESRPNHISEVLEGAGIRVLRNAAVPLERDGKRVWMAGLEDVLYGNQDLGVALQRVPATETAIALVHEPDYADEVSRSPVDLQLSGHSHGGQIRLPGVRPPYLPYMARKYPFGLYSVGRMKLYTNAGLGTIRVPIRLFAPPEVTLFNLRTRSG